ILRLKWTQSMITAFSVSLLGILISLFGFDASEGYLTSFAYSLHYSAMFIIGALLAINREKVVNIYNGLSFRNKVMLLVMGLCLYTLQIGFTYFFSSTNVLYFIRDWTTAIGASIFIVVSLGSGKVTNFLNKKYVEFLGKISYSLYLYHLPILFASLYFLDGTLPIWQILIIGVVLSILISTLSWKYVEKTSVQLGRVVSNKMARKQTSQNQKVA
ncbi:acyltransferase family protein, partial [Neobacillus drentensis]|uniref:acyltransferase family protein n=1 Tax=Neobacillus drentensis TaxID=220684 RepID=UPI00300223D7